VTTDFLFHPKLNSSLNSEPLGAAARTIAPPQGRRFGLPPPSIGMMQITRTSSAARDAAFVVGGLKDQHSKWNRKIRRDKTSI
jgi:hypothetical protein